MVIAAPNGLTTISVDPSGGDPLPSGLTVAAGEIVINQDLSDAGAPVALTVEAGASVDLNTSQQLSGLSIQAGATVDMTAVAGQTLNTTSVSVAGTLDLGDTGLVATAPTAADLSAIQEQLDSGGTLLNTGVVSVRGIYSSTPEALVEGDGGELFAEPVSTSSPATQPTTTPVAPNAFDSTPAKGAATTVVTGTVKHNGNAVDPGTGVVKVGIGNGPNYGPLGRNGKDPTVSPNSNLIADKDGKISIQIDLNGASPGDYVFKFRTTDLNQDDITVTVTIQ